MKLLIIVSNFLNKDVISSKRWRCISRELVQLGYEIDIITLDTQWTEEIKSFIEKETGVNCYCLNDACKKNDKKGKACSNKKEKKYINYFKVLYYFGANFKVKDMYIRKLKKMNKVEELHAAKYDYIISSIYNIEAFEIGFYIARKEKNVNLICDIRDPLIGSFFGNREANIFNTWLTKRIWKNSKLILTVSENIEKKLYEVVEKPENKKVFTLPHGYDRMEDMFHSKKPNSNEKLRIAYTGSYYKEIYDLEVLFSAVGLLKKEREIEIHVAGINSNVFLKAAEKYGMEDIVVNYGYVSKQKAIEIQQNAHILLYLALVQGGYKYDGLAGKFPEYLISEKPILAIVNSPNPQAWFFEEFKKLGVGIACDMHKRESIECVKEYLERQLLCLKKDGAVEYYFNFKECEKYSIKNIANNLNTILQHC